MSFKLRIYQNIRVTVITAIVDLNLWSRKVEGFSFKPSEYEEADLKALFVT